MKPFPAARIAIAAIAGSLFLPVAGKAQDQDFKMRLEFAEQCLEGKAGADRYACVGLAANDCQEINEGGGTTVGMGYCINRELEWWDGRLNAAYGELSARETADDAEAKSGGWSVPEKLPALKEMQRKWIAYRDALCEHEAVQWGGGTGSGPAYLACLMAETARQSFVLHDRLDYFGDR